MSDCRLGRLREAASRAGVNSCGQLSNERRLGLLSLEMAAYLGTPTSAPLPVVRACLGHVPKSRTANRGVAGLAPIQTRRSTQTRACHPLAIVAPERAPPARNDSAHNRSTSLLVV